jgi:argininosuccinate lyase
VVCDGLAMATAIVDSASFVEENIEPTLGRGFLDATSLAEYFVTRGIPFRTAHQIVGSLVARCEKEHKSQLSQLSLEDFRAAAQAHGYGANIAPSLYDSLGAANVARRYKTDGAAGGNPVDVQLADWAVRLKMKEV